MESGLICDAAFCGHWESEDPNDLVLTKAKTGHVIHLTRCSLFWRSVLQMETSVSTVMAECVALSSAMRELLPLDRLVRTVARIETGDEDVKIVTKSDGFEKKQCCIDCGKCSQDYPNE